MLRLSAPAIYPQKRAAGGPRPHVDEHNNRHCARADPIGRKILHPRAHQRHDERPRGAAKQNGEAQERLRLGIYSSEADVVFQERRYPFL
jgi:hypothetical protein